MRISYASELSLSDICNTALWSLFEKGLLNPACEPALTMAKLKAAWAIEPEYDASASEADILIEAIAGLEAGIVRQHPNVA